MTGNVRKPSEHLKDMLSGKVTPQDANPSILKWAEFQIWQAACEVCKMSSKEQRQAALTKFPDTIRPFVEREVKRLWPKRNNL